MSARSSGRAAILVIEHDDVLASHLHKSLIGAGYAARRVASAEQTLAMLESTPVDLILMSVLLPDSDGLVLCSTLKARCTTPIVMLSARDAEVERALALESGAADWLPTRPVDMRDLLARVESIVKTHTAAPACRA
jgi:DNA-binding response OmpR family regulator